MDRQDFLQALGIELIKEHKYQWRQMLIDKINIEIAIKKLITSIPEIKPANLLDNNKIDAELGEVFQYKELLFTYNITNDNLELIIMRVINGEIGDKHTKPATLLGDRPIIPLSHPNFKQALTDILEHERRA